MAQITDDNTELSFARISIYLYVLWPAYFGSLNCGTTTQISGDDDGNDDDDTAEITDSNTELTTFTHVYLFVGFVACRFRNVQLCYSPYY